MHFAPRLGPALLGLFLLLTAAPSRAADCNGNGIDDREDIHPTPRLLGREVIPAGTEVSAQVAIDLEGDLDLDLVLGEATGRGGIVLLKNDGHQRFRVEPRLATEEEGQEVFSFLEAVDLTGDGLADLVGSLVFAEDLEGRLPPPGRLVVLVQTQGGAFEKLEPLALDAPPVDAALGDLDQDGDLDLAVAVPFAVLFLRHQGKGVFEEAARFPVGSNPVAVRTGDLNGDQLTDVVTLNSLGSGELPGSVSVFLGGPGGRLGPPRNRAVGLRPNAIALGDWDGDQDLDLATTNLGSNDVTLLWNLGDGTFPDSTSFAAPFSPRDLRAGDFTGDGLLDLAFLSLDPACCGSQRHFVTIQENLGSGRFSPSWSAGLGVEELRLEAGDFDGNGPWDLFAVGGRPAVVLPLWNPASGDPGGVLTPPVSKGPSWVSQLLALDATSDGLLDLVLANKQAPEGGKLWRIRGRGDGTFEEKEPLPGPEGVVLSVARGDLNRDGLVDLAAAYFAPESLSLLLGRPDGGFDLSRTGIDAGPCHGLEVLDLDQDGFEDIAAADVSRNRFLVAWNDGKGGWDSLRVPGPQGSSAIAGGDLDGDSHMDLVVAAGAFANVVYGRGDRSFEAPHALEIGYVGAKPAIVDLDGDGKLDVLTHLVTWNEGLRQFSPPESYGHGTFSVLANSPTDLDGDGQLDLITATPSHLFFLRNQGQRGFAAGSSYLLPSVPSDLTVGDFDGDSRPDVVVVTPGLGSEPESEVLLFRNLTARPASSDRNQDGIPDECGPGAFHRGDTTGDGRLDLTDAVATLRFLFQSGASPQCLDAADSNDDERLDVSDAVFLLDYLFRGGDPPSSPGPPGAGKSCGLDTRSPVEALTCGLYEGC